MVPSVLITPTTIRKLLDDFSTLTPLLLNFFAAATASPAAVCSAPEPARYPHQVPDSKVRGDPHGTRGVTVRGHTHQVIDTVHILFDNLCHRVLHCFRISAGVGGEIVTAGGAIVGYCATGSLRIASPRQHDDNGDHPRKKSGDR